MDNKPTVLDVTTYYINNIYFWRSSWKWFASDSTMITTHFLNYPLTSTIVKVIE